MKGVKLWNCDDDDNVMMLMVMAMMMTMMTGRIQNYINIYRIITNQNDGDDGGGRGVVEVAVAGGFTGNQHKRLEHLETS